MKLKALSVTELNNFIADYMYTNPIFRMLSITGEIINVRKTNYGYVFFDLKDDNSKVSCMIFKNIELEEGKEVILKGRVNFYIAGGTYTFIAEECEIVGRGKYYENFRKLYEKLEKKNYFSIEHKKPLKKFPQKIGVVTSYTGAALQDILSVFKRRYPVIDVYIYDAKVQGQDIEKDIIRGIETLDSMDLDVIIISRGGGASDNLAAFNNENIADACFECNTSLISAIGHEIDYVIIDYIADFRAPTPSIAAEIAVPNIEEVSINLEQKFDRNRDLILNKIKSYEERLEGLKYIIDSFSPVSEIINLNHRIEILKNNIENNYKGSLNHLEFQLENLKTKVVSNNPLKILKSGYSVVEKNNKIISSYKDIKNSEEVVIKFYDGKIKAMLNIIKREKYE